MEAREKLRCISNGLKVFEDGRAGRVPRVKHFTCKLKFTTFNLAVRPQPQKPQKFVDLENFSSLRYVAEVFLGTGWILHVDIGQSWVTNKGEGHCSYK